jgi:tRNA pseudouridine38-40 synthase
MTSAHKLLLALAYNGERFLGNQLQPCGLPTVQGALLQAFQQLRLSPSNGKFAGRTDAGTHAVWQQFQCWLADCPYPLPDLVKRLNAVLPNDITVWDACHPTDGTFDVRQSAQWRWYRYQLTFNTNCWHNPAVTQYKLKRGHALPDTATLIRCADDMQGWHNFKAFQNTDTPVTDTQCHMLAARWQHVPTLTAPDTWQFDVVGTRFLYKMVRNVVAEHLAVAQQQLPSEVWRARLHQGLTRQSGQSTAPAQGLTLMSVYYPPCFQYFGKHTVVLQLEQALNALEFLDENLFCQAAGN